MTYSYQTGLGGMCGWFWWNVWLVLVECEAGSGGMCGWFSLAECVAG